MNVVLFKLNNFSIYCEVVVTGWFLCNDWKADVLINLIVDIYCVFVLNVRKTWYFMVREGFRENNLGGVVYGGQYCTAPQEGVKPYNTSGVIRTPGNPWI